jgi:P27 family predicted phage terminase small subunit
MPGFVKSTVGAAAEWKRLCPILDRMGVLTEADGDDLGFYCVELATYALCNRQVKRHGLTQTSEKGWSAPSAWATRRDSALLNCSRLGAKFGLSPADRTKIEVKPQDAKTEDPVAAVIAITSRKRTG